MKRRVITVLVGVTLASAVGAAPAWARADSTATETCNGTTTAVVDANAGPSLNFADGKFNQVAGVVLDFYCHTS